MIADGKEKVVRPQEVTHQQWDTKRMPKLFRLLRMILQKGANISVYEIVNTYESDEVKVWCDETDCEWTGEDGMTAVLHTADTGHSTLIMMKSIIRHSAKDQNG